MQYLGNDYYKLHKEDNTSTVLHLNDIKNVISGLGTLEVNIELNDNTKAQLESVVTDDFCVELECEEVLTEAKIIINISKQENN